MNKNYIAEKLKQIIDTLIANPRMHQLEFALIMFEAFGDLNSPLEYHFNLTTGRHSLKVREQSLLLDIDWTYACEAAVELTWFLNQFKQTVIMSNNITDILLTQQMECCQLISQP